MSVEQFESEEEIFGAVRLVPLQVVAKLCAILTPRRVSELLPAVLTIYDRDLDTPMVAGQLQTILKSRHADNLLSALLGLHDYHRRVMAPSPADLADPALPRLVELTDREYQVLCGMRQGKTNGEIGREHYLTEDTVKTHARRLFRKLGVRDRAHAVARGYDLGILRTPAGVA